MNPRDETNLEKIKAMTASTQTLPIATVHGIGYKAADD